VSDVLKKALRWEDPRAFVNLENQVVSCLVVEKIMKQCEIECQFVKTMGAIALSNALFLA
jgi:hypothetical protein